MSANAGGCALVHHVLEDAGYEIGDPRIENGMRLRGVLFFNGAISSHYRMNELRFGTLRVGKPEPSSFSNTCSDARKAALGPTPGGHRRARQNGLSLA